MNGIPSPLIAFRPLIVFFAAISLAVLPGPLSNQLHLPTVPTVRASVAPVTRWLPAGPSTNTETQAIPSSEFNAFLSEQIDLTDEPLTSELVNCLTPTGTCPIQIPNLQDFAVTSPIPTNDVFEVQVMEHNNFWGIPLNFGLDSNCSLTSATGIGVSDTACPGVSIRQALAHLIDKISFCANVGGSVSNIGSGACNALDNEVPPSEGLVAPDPCSWDALFPQTGGNCHVGAPGGTAYHLAATTGIGHDTGGVAASHPWEVATDNGGKADLCAAAAHLVAASVATGFNSTTCVLTGLSANAQLHPVNIFARIDRPERLFLGDGLMEDLCYLFTGHWASSACQQVATPTTACSGPCVVTETRGGFCCFPGFTTGTKGINDDWWLYTGGFGGVFPFDSLLYDQFNSQFVSGVGAADQPPCSSLAISTPAAENYQYTCVSTYDTISNQVEFSPCLSATGDPSTTQSVETGPPVSFANCSGTTKLSAISAGYQAEDILGKLAMFIPIYSPIQQFGYLAKWNNVINALNTGIPNLFTWLDASSPSSTSVTQGFFYTTSSLNPYVASSQLDFQTLRVLYDRVGIPNPANDNQYFDYLASAHSTPCNSNIGVACSPATLGYAPPIGTVATIRFSLRPDIFWQSDSAGTAHPARPLTSYDVKFSYLTLKSAGTFQGISLAPLLDVHVLDKANFDLNLNTLGPFTLPVITSPTIIPGRYWSSTCQGTAWDADVAAGVVPDSCMAVSKRMSAATFDPIASTPDNGASAGILIGSGGFECQSTAGVVGTGCSSSGAENPPVGGSYTMTRFGCNRATATCNSPGANPTTTYFRSAGNLALTIWSGTNSVTSHDTVVVGSIANCFQKPVGTLGCTRWQRGIGNPGSGTIVDIPQISTVIRSAQDGNWVYPFSWLPGILETCCPFSANAPDGIQIATPVLVEGTAILNPCSIDPTNGYDC